MLCTWIHIIEDFSDQLVIMEPNYGQLTMVTTQWRWRAADTMDTQAPHKDAKIAFFFYHLL